MKRFMTSTAIALLMGTSAMAQDHMSMFSSEPFNAQVNLYASELVGARVYATESSLDSTMSVNADQTAEWDDIGEINEIILTREGEVQSVIVGVGGFLGIGEKDVAINMSELRFVSDGDDPDDYFLVVNANSELIMEADAYERADMGADMGGDMGSEIARDADRAMDDMADEAGDAMDTMEHADAMDGDHARDPALMMAPSIEREGYRTVTIDDLTTEDLTGARVYGVGDEDVGEISELIVSTDGVIEEAAIDVGGFLGIGEHTVAVSFDELTVIRADDGGDLRVYIDSSQEALEAQPEYEG
ncbi:PRC-barrel domain-containing protein [Pararhodobacter oceanensis]|uniref:PRC protein n=1 Tax=Pararhodobacter oceanensis TaxID=2172121 RepID=A0A2T8HUQ5_9RHOB|nr:PRC-barrel domain-containing protein [Pararhodobacter oceanensis]PVH29151.1 PRC protein [Pararhodobacter oceanensis]